MNHEAVKIEDWRAVKKDIVQEIQRIWLQEPVEIKKIRYGIIASGAGSGKQSFSVLVHLEAYLMLVGADVMYRFLKVSQYEEIALPELVRMTREFLVASFNAFEFLTDLGIPRMHEIGNRYAAALDLVQSKEEYVELTGAMMTYVIRMHRWVHFIFPWNLGVAFPHANVAELKSLVASL